MNSKSIAIVEDEPTHATLVKYNLESRGFWVEHYINGESFLNGIAPGIYDLIIINAQLSDMDGLELSKRIREKGVMIPLLYLTTSVPVHSSWSLAPTGYLSKPFKVSALLDKVESMISASSFSYVR